MTSYMFSYKVIVTKNNAYGIEICIYRLIAHRCTNASIKINMKSKKIFLYVLLLEM